MTGKTFTFNDCIQNAAIALHAATANADGPGARVLITVAEQWMNLARMVPPSYPAAVPQQYLGLYGHPYAPPPPFSYPQPPVPDYPPEGDA